MKLVIPWLGSDSTELRYCLRSMDMHMKGVTGLIIIGYAPPGWLKDYTHIRYRDDINQKWSHRNVWEKLQTVQEEEFLWSADDVYLLKDFRAKRLPYYFTGPLTDQLTGRNPKNPYYATLSNTLDFIGLEAIAYNTHCPIVIDKDRLNATMIKMETIEGNLQVTGEVDWNKPYGYCIKTLYAQGMKGMQIADCKLMAKEQDLTGRPWFSTSPTFMRRGGERLLKGLYPRPSRWEKH